MNTQDTVEKHIKATRFYKDGGSCWECCEYEDMVADLRGILTTAIEEAQKEERERIVRCANHHMVYTDSKDFLDGYNEALAYIITVPPRMNKI